MEKNKEKKGRIARCMDCGYTALTYYERCSKCRGELEIIAEEIIK